MPLVALIGALAAGHSIAAILGGYSLAQWIALARAVVSLGEEAINLLATYHGSLAAMGDALIEGLGADVAGKAAKDWIAANAAKAVELQPGIGGQ